MKYLTLFFIFVQMYFLMNAKDIYYLLYQYMDVIKLKNEFPDKKQVIVVNEASISFILYMLADFAFLLYCLWLLLHDAYWQRGGLLFIISSLESYAHHMKISYTYTTDEAGFTYPNIAFRCFFSGTTLFILTKLYASL